MRWHVYVPFRQLNHKLPEILKEGFSPEFYLDAFQLQDISSWNIARDILKGYDVKPSLHVTLVDLNPGSPDPEISAVTKKRFKQNFEFAHFIGIKDLVIHTAFDPFRYHFFMKEFKESTLSFWKDLEKDINDFNIALENVFDRESLFLKDLIETLNVEIKGCNFGWCFDIGHANLFNKITHEEWIESLAKYLMEIHIHDNKGEYDDHLSLGEGNIAYYKIISLLREKIINDDIILNFELEKTEWAIDSRRKIKEYINE